ncbi:MAG: LPS assembly lipoprotein LptE [Prevotellaceae bacterium]|nr:LPS assembly lipoprotein LptE [Prevotellaceae bacterium]
MKKILYFTLPLLLVVACSVSYKMNGASIDYTKTKTISINDFRNIAAYVNPNLAPAFNEALRDIYAKQTRLQSVRVDGDLQLEGEITGYDFAQMSIAADAIAAETRLTVTVKVRFTNKTNPTKSFERSFSAFQNYANTRSLADVQDEICKAIIDEITETIYNQTVADW